MKKLNALLQVITVLEIVFFPFQVDAKADYSLLIGEWSNTERVTECALCIRQIDIIGGWKRNKAVGSPTLRGFMPH